MKEKSDNELIAEFMGGQDLIWYHTLLDRDRECDYQSNWSKPSLSSSKKTGKCKKALKALE